MLRLVGGSVDFEAVQAVTGPEKIAALQKEIESVAVSDEVTEYIVAITTATRRSPELRLGASPRASRALYRAAKALAAVSGRDFVIPDDVKELAAPVLCHRLMLSAKAVMAGQTAESVLAQIMETIPVPPAKEALFEKEHG